MKLIHAMPLLLTSKSTVLWFVTKAWVHAHVFIAKLHLQLMCIKAQDIQPNLKALDGKGQYGDPITHPLA